MKKISLLLTLAAMLAVAGSSQAASYAVDSFNPTKHSVWIKDYQENLHFDPAGTLEIGAAQWTLTGTLESADDGSIWSISVVFDHVKTGDEYKAIVGGDNDAIKGNSWANQQADWAFARDISGSITQTSGPNAGLTFAIDRFVNSNNYWAQFGTGMNDKNGELGLSTWLNFTQLGPQAAPTDIVYRGDINVNASNPVPEPSAALAFAVGSLVVGASTRRRKS